MRKLFREASQFWGLIDNIWSSSWHNVKTKRDVMLWKFEENRKINCLNGFPSFFFYSLTNSQSVALSLSLFLHPFYIHLDAFTSFFQQKKIDRKFPSLYRHRSSSVYCKTVRYFLSFFFSYTIRLPFFHALNIQPLKHEKCNQQWDLHKS